jgi:hypothetical protein
LARNLLAATKRKLSRARTKFSWLLLAYKVPQDPSRTRVGIWRAIKSLGAVYLQASVYVLPNSVEHRRQLKILQNKIVEAGGTADVLETGAMDREQEASIVRRFREDREDEYEEFLGKCDDYLAELKRETQTRHFTFAELQENDEDLKKLTGWLRKIEGLDFYHAPRATDAHQRLKVCVEALDEFADRVYEVEEHSRPRQLSGDRSYSVRRARRKR